MTEDSPATLSILVPAEDADRDRVEVRFRRKEVPVDSLRNSLADYLAKMEDALNGVPASLSGYQVDEITLSLEVSATGKVSMLGTGAEVTGTGGLTLTLKRRDSDAS